MTLSGPSNLDVQPSASKKSRPKAAIMFEKFPLIKRIFKVTGQILLGSAAIIAVALIVKFLLDPAVRTIFGVEGPNVKIILRLVTIALFGFAYFAFVKFFEKRPVTELAFRGRNMLYGALSGALIISITTFSLFALGYYEFVSFLGFDNMIFMGSAILAASIFEEFIFRGVLFRILEQHVGTLKSLLSVSILFGAVHIFNEGSGPLIFVSAALIGALWCGVYALSRNIWVVGLHHAAWNLAIFSSGIPLSGVEEFAGKAPIESTYEGPLLITGGAFGPEGSIITLVVVAISTFLVLRWARQKNRFIKI